MIFYFVKVIALGKTQGRICLGKKKGSMIYKKIKTINLEFCISISLSETMYIMWPEKWNQTNQLRRFPGPGTVGRQTWSTSYHQVAAAK